MSESNPIPPTPEQVQEVLVAISASLKNYIRGRGGRSATAIVQETYVSVVNAYQNTNCKTPRDLNDVPRWLYAIARSNAAKYRRTNRRTKTGIDEKTFVEVKATDSAALPEEVAYAQQCDDEQRREEEKKQITEIVERFMECLNEHDKIVCTTLDGVSQEDVAVELGCGRNQISHKRRALRSKVKRWLAETYPETDFESLILPR